MSAPEPGPLNPEPPGTPGISVLLYLAGSVALFAMILAFVAAGSDTGVSSTVDVEMGFGTAIPGFVLFGLGYGLHKLNQIEHHLPRL